MAPAPAAPKFLTVGGVAHRLTVLGDTPSRWAKTGRLPSTRTLGGHLRFDRAFVDTLADGLAYVPAETES